MKKLSELKQEIADNKREEEARKREALGHILSAAARVKNGCTINKSIKEDLLYKITVTLNGGVSLVEVYALLCDNCETQLVNPYPNNAKTKKHVSCAGCGWVDYTEFDI